ncbi:hypothetical protein PY254_14600 [Rhodanobacter sp. AS-Z3]|uniref:hypothetical protein n=1 Tax=Rhodanobacter sp. AS-Z3 TaxID=3031330 RepID=UPI002479E114|nr:hypothetical protein [Rhodanobacter sp. AS-Z3]WEN14450.1 hypothetical protein PY254_14600 [Rhodanobacter sp. AS-Z3]
MQRPVRSIHRVVAAVLAIIWLLVGAVGFIVMARSGQWWWALFGLFAFWYAWVWVLVVAKGRLLTWQEASRPWRIHAPEPGKPSASPRKKQRDA